MGTEDTSYGERVAAERHLESIKKYVLFRAQQESGFDPDVVKAKEDDTGVCITVPLKGGLSWDITTQKVTNLAASMNALFEGTATATVDVIHVPRPGEVDTLEVRLKADDVKALYDKIKEKDPEGLKKAEAQLRSR